MDKTIHENYSPGSQKPHINVKEVLQQYLQQAA